METLPSDSAANFLDYSIRPSILGDAGCERVVDAGSVDIENFRSIDSLVRNRRGAAGARPEADIELDHGLARVAHGLA